MNTGLSAFSLKKQANAVEWKLLVFLVLFMDVKLYVKVAAIVLIIIMQPDFRFGFRLRNSRLPLFYPLAIGIAVLNWLIYQQFTVNYSLVLLTGILFWAACILAVHQVKLFVERTDVQILHNTLVVFFLLNIAVSLLNLSAIFLEIGLRNPFHYQGLYQKYFINTGDHIKGLSFDNSTTNALINGFGVVYFLYRGKYWFSIACMIILILTASNFTNLILLFVFAVLFLLKSTRDQKSIMVVCSILLVVFLAKFSPQNDHYINELFGKFVLKKKEKAVAPVKVLPIRERPDSLLDPEGRREKIATLYLDSLEKIAMLQVTPGNGLSRISIAALKERPEIPGDSIHTAKFQWKRDTTAIQRQILTYAEKQSIEPAVINSEYNGSMPGKLLSFKESINFFKGERARIFTGNGMGNFSSKLAFRATGLKLAGGYPKQFVYSNRDFLENHFSLYTYFFTKNAGAHSLVNNPASVYDQVFTEYGIFGMAALIFYYVGFFFRDRSKLTYGIPILGLMLAAFLMDYWFEQLSIVVLFELMMFIDIKEHTKYTVNE